MNAPITVGGVTYFSTNRPVAVSVTSCTSNLGEAKAYALDPFTSTISSTVLDGGGLPPSPVAGLVEVPNQDGGTDVVPFIIGAGTGIGADAGSGLGASIPPITVPTTRHRTFWYINTDN